MTRLINDEFANDMTFGGFAEQTISALAAKLAKKSILGGWLVGMGFSWAKGLAKAGAGEIGASRGYKMIVENCKKLWQD